jgi:hypothetical protein
LITCAARVRTDSLKGLESLQTELAFLREHNRAGGEPLPTAEAALLLLTLERFLRLLPGVNAADKETLPQLLQRAVAIGTLRLPSGDNGSVIDAIRKFRNALLHANHEQAGRGRGLTLADLHILVEDLLGQVDPATGLRRTI